MKQKLKLGTLVCIILAIVSCKQEHGPLAEDISTSSEGMPLITIEYMDNSDHLTESFYVFQENFILGFRCISSYDTNPTGSVSFGRHANNDSSRVVIPRNLYSWHDGDFNEIKGDNMPMSFFSGAMGGDNERAYSVHLIKLKADEFRDWIVNEFTDEELLSCSFGIPICVQSDDAVIVEEAERFWIDINLNKHLIGFDNIQNPIVDLKLSDYSTEKIKYYIDLKMPQFNNLIFPRDFVIVYTGDIYVRMYNHNVPENEQLHYLSEGWLLDGNAPSQSVCIDPRVYPIVSDKVQLCLEINSKMLKEVYSEEMLRNSSYVVPLKVTIYKDRLKNSFDFEGNSITTYDLSLCNRFIDIDSDNQKFFIRISY